MTQDKLSYLQKNYDTHLTKMSPSEKLNFLERAILKRKSLIVMSSVAKKRHQKS